MHRLIGVGHGQRMVERAVHWVDRVFPHVPVRQWVLTFPWSLRLRLARDHGALKALRGIFGRAVRRWYRIRARTLLGPLQAASIARRVALGKRAGRIVRRYRILSSKRVDLPPRCGKKMRLRTVVTHPPATFRVLEGLARSARAPPALFCLPAGGEPA